MTTENTELAVKAIDSMFDESDVHGLIDEEMIEWVDDEDIEEHGSLYDAYSEVGRGEAERNVLDTIIKGNPVPLNTDEYCEVMDTLCEIWGININ